VRRFTSSATGADLNATDVVVVERSPVREILRQARSALSIWNSIDSISRRMLARA
jgi:hypothetical protein